MHWYGWQWNPHIKRNAVLLWRAIASDGVHGPGACALWRYIMSDFWHDWTRGHSWVLVNYLSFYWVSFFFLFFLGGWGFGYLLYAWPMVAFDCVCLQNEGYVTLRDVKSSKLSGHVFNILFNLNKFIAFESRDAFLIRQVNANSYILIFASIQGIVLW